MAARKPTKAVEAPMIQIGASPATIQSARETINAILSAPHADESTKRAALQAFDHVCSVNNTSLTGCSLVRDAGK